LITTIPCVAWPDMNRSHYFNYIEDRLTHLACKIEVRGKLNILDLNLHSENFYLQFFNKLFNWELINLNSVAQNVEAIDLIDHTNLIIIQVSSTSTKAKIEAALKKDLSKYVLYAFKFISICRDASDLRKLTYINTHKIAFNPADDIYDVVKILNIILSLDIEKQRPLFDFVKLELGSEPDPEKVESNLATLIELLALEDLDSNTSPLEINSFEIERKITHNNLKSAKVIIDDYSAHFHTVDKIYSEFNKQGNNKSTSVLAAIRSLYILHKSTLSDDALFFKIIEDVVTKIKSSSNYNPIPYEELDLCVNVLVVDAFIRCKIFENPMNYTYATT
jgi:hypothetical protein